MNAPTAAPTLPGQPVFIFPPNPQQPAPSRPWLSWALSAALALLLAYKTGVMPQLPPLPMAPAPAPIQPPAPVQPPAPQPPARPAPNPVDAIARIQFGSAGCTAAPIGPRLASGQYLVLTAAHCVERIGQVGGMRFKDGRQVAIQVVAMDKRSDAAWCVTVSNTAELPALELADRPPPAGARVWHAGYGFDKPTNREEGQVIEPENSEGQTQFRISVSSGDSGGPFMLDADGRVVGCVCCTTRIANVGQVWGASVNAIRRLRPERVAAFDWAPSPVPECGSLKKD